MRSERSSSAWSKFSNLQLIFKNIDVTKTDIGEYMNTYAEENVLSKNNNECWYRASNWPTEHLAHHFSIFN